MTDYADYEDCLNFFFFNFSLLWFSGITFLGINKSTNMETFTAIFWIWLVIYTSFLLKFMETCSQLELVLSCSRSKLPDLFHLSVWFLSRPACQPDWNPVNNKDLQSMFTLKWGLFLTKSRPCYISLFLGKKKNWSTQFSNDFIWA